MTRSPIISTLLALIPLAALAIPLSWVLAPSPDSQVPLIEAAPGKLVRCDIFLRSTPPFEEVLVNDSLFTKGELEKELFLDLSDTVTVKVKWPSGTAEAALLIEVIPDDFEMKSHTLWGSESALEEINFQWEVAP